MSPLYDCFISNYLIREVCSWDTGRGKSTRNLISKVMDNFERKNFNIKIKFSQKLKFTFQFQFHLTIIKPFFAQLKHPSTSPPPPPSPPSPNSNSKKSPISLIS